MDTSGELQSILRELDNSLTGQIEGSLIASADGFLVAHTLSDAEDAERIAAMVATTMGVSRRMAATLDAGDLNETSISASKRLVQLYLVGDRGALAVVAEAGSNIALINIKAREQVGAAQKAIKAVVA